MPSRKWDSDVPFYAHPRWTSGDYSWDLKCRCGHITNSRGKVSNDPNLLFTCGGCRRDLPVHSFTMVEFRDRS